MRRIACHLCWLLLSFACSCVYAHLLSAGIGAINLQKDSAYVILAIPLNDLPVFVPPKSGPIKIETIQAQRAELLRQLRLSVTLTAGKNTGRLVFEDLVVSTHKHHSNESIEQIEWVARYQWDEPPSPDAALVISLNFLHHLHSQHSAYNLVLTDGAQKTHARLDAEHPVHVFVRGKATEGETQAIEKYIDIPPSPVSIPWLTLLHSLLLTLATSVVAWSCISCYFAPTPWLSWRKQLVALACLFIVFAQTGIPLISLNVQR